MCVHTQPRLRKGETKKCLRASHTTPLWPPSRGRWCSCTGQREFIRAAVCVRTWRTRKTKGCGKVHIESVFSRSRHTSILLNVSIHQTVPMFINAPSLFLSCQVKHYLLFKVTQISHCMCFIICINESINTKHCGFPHEANMQTILVQ